MSRPFKIFSLFVVVVAIGVLIYLVPNFLASNMPSYLNKNIGSFLVVDHSEFNREPPELVMTGIHLKNPGEFGNGDAITIRQINVVFNNYSHDPYDIKSIAVQNIRGKQIFRNDTDNLTAVHSLLMDRKYQTPHGQMAKPAVLGNLVIHDSVISNETGQVVTPLQDKNLTPAGAMLDNPPLQNVIIDVMGTVVEQQQAGAGDIKLQNMADKATETIKEIGSSLKSFLNAK